MTTSIPLPIGSYARRDPRAGSRRLINTFVDPDDPNAAAAIASDVKNPSPVKMRRWAGISPFADDTTGNPVRGASLMRGVQYVVIGSSLYTLSSLGVLVQVGSGIAGNGFVRMTNNTNCLFILVPGTSIAYTYCPAAGGFATFTDPFFLAYGAIDVQFIDTYFTFLIANQSQGNGFYNDDGTAVSGVGPPTFTTGAVFFREFGTDPFVGMCVDHREVMCLGQKTTEGYVNAGNATGSPFQSAPDSYMQIGCHLQAAYSVALQDQSFFWVAQDRTVRRRSGQTPTRVSNSGIEEILEKADLTGCYALTPTIAGHPLWIFTMPAATVGRTIVYDCLTQEWFELSSQGLYYWQPFCHFEAFGGQYVGSKLRGQIGLLDTTVFTEFGAPMVTQFITQSIYDMNNRITHRRLELVMTVGESPQLNYAPIISLFVSDDGGQTYRANGQPTTLGIEGQYSWRATWFNLGQARNRAYKFEISDPTPLYTIDMTTEVSGGKW